MSDSSDPVLPSNHQQPRYIDEFRDCIEAAHDGSLRLHNRYTDKHYRLDSYSHKRKQATLIEITDNAKVITMDYKQIFNYLFFTATDPKQMQLNQC